MPIIVQKYGGTSVEGHERILAVARRVAALKESGYDVVVVVSAQGSTTDALVKEAHRLTREPAQRELDMLMTAGERISMSLLAIALNSIGCPATSFTGSQVGIITDTRHTDARILEVRPNRVIRELRRGSVVVVGGFQGVSTEKDVTTLGRGGSDTTAVALAAALDAECCDILTDVDGLYTADPRIVENARRIDSISYEDMAELARFGARVLKEEAVRFAEREGIAISIGASLGDAPGTIVLERAAAPEDPIVGLSALSEVALVSREGWNRPPRASDGGSLDSATLFTFFDGDRAVTAIAQEGLASALSDCGHATLVREAAVVCIVGASAGRAPTMARARRAVEGIGAGVLAGVASGRSTLLAVGRDTTDVALNALHSEFFPVTTATRR